MRASTKTWLWALLAASAVYCCRADSVVLAPRPPETNSQYYPLYGPSDTNSLYPLLIKQAGFTNPPTMRYQQVYNASLFTNLDSGYITQVGFFLFHTNPNLIDWTVPNVQINLSTTPKGANSLSPVFSENTGPDDTVVFGPKSCSFDGYFSDSELDIPLERSFHYDPTKGNLLVDIRVFDGSGTIDTNRLALEAVSSPTNGVSRAWSTNVNSLTADGMDATSLATAFLFTPDVFVTVPSPRVTDGNTLLPFLLRQGYFGPTNTSLSMRYQQVYGSNLFSNLDPSLIYITALTFYLQFPKPPNDFTTGASWTLHNLQIDLSTTAKGPGALSPALGDNPGADDAIVFGPRTNFLTASTSTAAYDGPMTIYLDRPFRYNPALGNLLMDIRLTDNINDMSYLFTKPALEVFSTPTGEVSRLWATNLTAAVADGMDTNGLATVFQFDTIPALSAEFETNIYGESITNAIHIQWPSQPSIFVLQRTDQLGPNAIWTNDTNQVGGSIRGSGRFIDVPVATPPQRGFYRLVWPAGQ